MIVTYSKFESEYPITLTWERICHLFSDPTCYVSDEKNLPSIKLRTFNTISGLEFRCTDVSAWFVYSQLQTENIKALIIDRRDEYGYSCDVLIPIYWFQFNTTATLALANLLVNLSLSENIVPFRDWEPCAFGTHYGFKHGRLTYQSKGRVFGSTSSDRAFVKGFEWWRVVA